MKRCLLTIVLLLSANVAYAQSPTSIPIPTELTLKVNPPEADLIWRGLRKLPVEDVEGLMVKLHQQVTEQTTPKPVITPKPVESATPPKVEEKK